MATETEHGVVQLHHFGIGRATSFALKGRCRSLSQKDHCTLAPGHSFLSIHYWSDTRYSGYVDLNSDPSKLLFGNSKRIGT